MDFSPDLLSTLRNARDRTYLRNPIPLSTHKFSHFYVHKPSQLCSLSFRLPTCSSYTVPVTMALTSCSLRTSLTDDDRLAFLFIHGLRYIPFFRLQHYLMHATVLNPHIFFSAWSSHGIIVLYSYVSVVISHTLACHPFFLQWLRCLLYLSWTHTYRCSLSWDDCFLQ